MAGESELLLRIGADVRQWEAGLKRTESGAAGLKNRLAAKYKSITQDLSRRIANPLTALLGGAAVLKATHDLMLFDSTLARVAINGNLSAAEQAKLRDEITATAVATGQSREQLVESLRAMPEDLEFARSVLRDMAITATATGASMADLGSLTDNLQEKMGLAREEMKDAFALLVGQGKVGGMTLDKLAGTSDRLFAAAQRIGAKGMGGLAEFGALLQVASKSAGGGERGMMAVETILNDIVEKRKAIAKHSGVDVFKPGSKTELRSIGEIIKGIVKGTGGDIVKLEEIFGPGSMRVMTALVDDYKATGGFALFDGLVAGGDKAAVMRDFSRYTQEATHQLNVFKAVGAEFAGAAIGPVLKDLSDRMREITSNPEKLEAMRAGFQRFGEDVSAVAKGLIPILTLLAKAAEGLNWLGDRLTGTGEYGEGSYVDWFKAQKHVRDIEKQNSAKTLWKGLPEEERDLIGAKGDFWKGATWDRKVYEAAAHQKQLQQNNINVNVNVGADGRAVTDVDAPNAQVSATTNRGSLAFAGN